MNECNFILFWTSKWLVIAVNASIHSTPILFLAYSNRKNYYNTWAPSSCAW